MFPLIAGLIVLALFLIALSKDHELQKVQEDVARAHTELTALLVTVEGDVKIKVASALDHLKKWL